MAAEQNPKPDPLPPLAPDELPPAPRITNWPRKLGIFSIIFALFGGVTSALTLVSVLALRHSPRAIETIAKTDAQKEFVRSSLVQTWLAISTVGAILSVALAVLLLVCAIGLIRRRAWSIKGLFAWAALKVILEAAGAYLEYAMYAKIDQAISQGLLEAASVPLIFRTWSVGAMAFSLMISCGLAIFVLIWLARADTREEVAMWR